MKKLLMAVTLTLIAQAQDVKIEEIADNTYQVIVNNQTMGNCSNLTNNNAINAFKEGINVNIFGAQDFCKANGGDWSEIIEFKCPNGSMVGNFYNGNGGLVKVCYNNAVRSSKSNKSVVTCPPGFYAVNQVSGPTFGTGYGYGDANMCVSNETPYL